VNEKLTRASAIESDVARGSYSKQVHRWRIETIYVLRDSVRDSCSRAFRGIADKNNLCGVADRGNVPSCSGFHREAVSARGYVYYIRPQVGSKTILPSAEERGRHRRDASVTDASHDKDQGGDEKQ